MLDFQKIWNYYSRESILKTIVEVAKDREVVSVFRDGRFGKRPDVIQYPKDIVQAVAEGTVAFHGSVERWQQPMKLDVGLSKSDLDALRIAWDIFIDIDVDDFEIAKMAAKQIFEVLKDNGVHSYNVKFTGGSSFHIGIPFESLPEKINMQKTSVLYPDLLQKIIEYLKWYSKENLKQELQSIGSPKDIAQRVGKKVEEITDNEGIIPFKVISMDIFGSRHLFRLPYSLHESSGLVSLPIKPQNILKFDKEQALPEKVKVEEKFLVPVVHLHDAEALVVEAMDWSAKYMVEKKEEIPKFFKQRPMRAIPEEYFPPCIKAILNGVSDGRKRSVFILINFLRNMNWDLDKIEKRLYEWNEKNIPPLRTNYLRTQLRWHFRQERSLLPPNCDNANFYEAMGVHKFCEHLHKEGIKNPINYPLRMLKNRKTLREMQKK